MGEYFFSVVVPKTQLMAGSINALIVETLCSARVRGIATSSIRSRCSRARNWRNTIAAIRRLEWAARHCRRGALAWEMVPGDAGGAEDGWTCLLYTSPSPRD